MEANKVEAKTAEAYDGKAWWYRLLARYPNSPLPPGVPAKIRKAKPLKPLWYRKIVEDFKGFK